jgi:hypothetical protein
MKIIFLFIILSILLLILNKLGVNNNVNNSIEHFTQSMPLNMIIVADNEFQCFYNGALISSGNQWNNTYRFTINNVRPNTQIFFGVTNRGGQGGIRFQFTYGSSTYYSNMSNLRCIGKQLVANGTIIPNRFMGCFADNGNRDLPLFAGNMSRDQCMNFALNQNMPFYGLQNGGECWLGNNFGRYGTSTNCNRRCNQNSNENCGGSWANQVYSRNQLPETIIVPSNNNPNFDSRAQTLWVNSGDPSAQGRWLFELTVPSTEKLDFCPDPDYEEFNPAGCLNARTTANCRTSVLSNYNASIQKCSKLYNKDDPDKFYMVMNKVFKFVYDIDSRSTSVNTSINATRNIETTTPTTNNCLVSRTNTTQMNTQIKMTNQTFINRLRAKSLDPPRQGFSSGSIYLNEFFQSNFIMLGLLKIIGDNIKYPMDPTQLIENQLVLPDSPMYYALVKEALRYSNNHRNQLSQIFMDNFNRTYLLARIIINTPTIANECSCLGLSFTDSQQCVPC